MKIEEKVAIVTGASSGIGLAVAKLLSKKGAKVALAARSLDKLNELSKELPQSIAIPTDMTNESQIKNMVSLAQQHFGGVDILVNSAGQGYDALIVNTNIQTTQRIFFLDVLAPLIAMQQVIPNMQKQGGGSIINVSSGTALMNLPGMGMYSAIKRAMAHLSLTAREELKKDHIAVGVVYPYMTDTDFEKNTLKETLDSIWEGQGEGEYEPPPMDSPELVAEKIIEGIETGEAEIYIHDWMKPRNRNGHQ